MDKVKVGSIVTIKLDEKNEQTYIIVSNKQHQEIKSSTNKVPFNFVIKNSEMGKALMGKSLGQKTTVKLFDTVHKIEILSITYSI